MNKIKTAREHFLSGEYCEGNDRLDEAIAEYQKSLEIEFNKDLSLRLIRLCRFTGNNSLIKERVPRDLGFIPGGDLFYRNMLLNELEIAQKKTVLSSKLTNFIVTVTNRCNLACLACEARQYKWEISRPTINEIIAYFPYLEHIMWQGGEVFLLDYFKDILDEAERHPNMKQLIVTNAMLLTQDMIKKLVMQPRLVLAISVDGTTKDVYEGIRRGGSFEKLIENIRTINLMKQQFHSNIRLHLNVTVMKSNYHQLADFIEFAKDHSFETVLLRPVQGNFESPENIFFSNDNEALGFIDKVMNELEERAGKYNIRLDNRIPRRCQGPPAGNREKNSDIKASRLLCYAPWQRLYISWDGNVFPDCMCVWPKDDGIGNVKRESINEIWNNAGMQAYRKKILDSEYMDICGPDCVSGNVPERYLTFNR